MSIASSLWGQSLSGTDRFSATAFDAVRVVAENIEAIVGAGYAAGTLSEVLFSRFVATSGQTVFTGPDLSGRPLQVPGPTAQVYVNQRRMTQGSQYVIEGNGAQIRFLGPLVGGAEVLVSNFAFAPDGSIYFDQRHSPAALIALTDAMGTAADSLDLTLAQSQDTLEGLVLAAASAAETAAADAAVALAPAAADAIRAQVAVDADRAETAAVLVTGPFETIPSGSMQVLRVDDQGQAIEVMRPTGVDMHMADEFWQRAPEPAALAVPFDVVQGVGVTATRLDAQGRAIEVMREDGLDAHMSAQFWARGAEFLGGGGTAPSGLSTTEIDILSINGQSLTVSADYTATVTRAGMEARVGPAALMLTGLRRGDGVALNDTLGPRSQAYDTATPAVAMAPALPSTAIAGLPFAVATVLNDHRADAGVPQVPVLHSGHGISGIPIEQMDDDPLTGGTTATVVWGNLTYWSAEARRVALAAGLTVRQPWYVWTHGTSAKSMARGAYATAWWDLQADSIAYYRSIDLPAPRWIITQSGGDANTVGDIWAVCDDQLDICEAGGAVLATPLYWYEIADNNVHPDGEGVALFGETYAWAMAEVEAGRRWTITRPVATWDAAASVLVLDFASLREDEWLEAEDAAKYAAHGGIGLGAAHLGFEAVGATITGLTLRGRTARLACSAKPTAVQYAMQTQDMSGLPGNRYNGHRGLLRTSIRKTSKLVPGKMLVRAIPSFTLSIL